MRLLPQFLSRFERIQLLPFLEYETYEPGRQGTGYERMSVLSSSWAAFVSKGIRERALHALEMPPETGYDCYFLRFPTGAYLPEHFDNAPLATEHHRINIMINAPEAGGDLVVEKKLYSLKDGDAYVFEPSKERHEVRKVLAGTRLMFTLGVRR